MFIFVVQNLQKKWNKIRMKQLASRKHMKNDCFPRTLKFKMSVLAGLGKDGLYSCSPFALKDSPQFVSRKIIIIIFKKIIYICILFIY
jgi:hypothetical protein